MSLAMGLNFQIDRNNVYKEGSEQLPTDKAYVCEIKGAKEVDYTTDSGYRVHRVDIALDVCEGEYEGFYQKKFDDSQDEDKKWKGVVKLNIPKFDGTGTGQAGSVKWMTSKESTMQEIIQTSNQEREMKMKFYWNF